MGQTGPGEMHVLRTFGFLCPLIFFYHARNISWLQIFWQWNTAGSKIVLQGKNKGLRYRTGWRRQRWGCWESEESLVFWHPEYKTKIQYLARHCDSLIPVWPADSTIPIQICVPWQFYHPLRASCKQPGGDGTHLSKKRSRFHSCMFTSLSSVILDKLI